MVVVYICQMWSVDREFVPEKVALVCSHPSTLIHENNMGERDYIEMLVQRTVSKREFSRKVCVWDIQWTTNGYGYLCWKKPEREREGGGVPGKCCVCM